MLKISYEDGSSQIMKPTRLTDFEKVNWHEVASTIAQGRPHTWKFIPLDTE
jgi:hypothetical protein